MFLKKFNNRQVFLTKMPIDEKVDRYIINRIKEKLEGNQLRLRSRVIQFESLYKSSKGGQDQPLNIIQIALDDDEGFPIPNYFIILEGKKDFSLEKTIFRFINKLERKARERFNEYIDISHLWSEYANMETLKEDGFEKIYP